MGFLDQHILKTATGWVAQQLAFELCYQILSSYPWIYAILLGSPTELHTSR